MHVGNASFQTIYSFSSHFVDKLNVEFKHPETSKCFYIEQTPSSAHGDTLKASRMLQCC